MSVPGAISNFVVTSSDGEHIALIWDAASGASWYTVARLTVNDAGSFYSEFAADSDSGGAATTYSHTYADWGGVDGTAYFWFVRGYNMDGDGPVAGPIAHTYSTTPPPDPTNDRVWPRGSLLRSGPGSVDAAIPAGAAGDLLIVYATTTPTTPTTPTLTAPSGWTTLDDHDQGYMRLGTYVRVADGTESSATWTCSNGDTVAAVCVRLAGWSRYTWTGTNAGPGQDDQPSAFYTAAAGRVGVFGFVSSGTAYDGYSGFDGTRTHEADTTLHQTDGSQFAYIDPFHFEQWGDSVLSVDTETGAATSGYRTADPNFDSHVNGPGDGNGPYTVGRVVMVDYDPYYINPTPEPVCEVTDLFNRTGSGELGTPDSGGTYEYFGLDNGSMDVAALAYVRQTGPGASVQGALHSATVAADAQLREEFEVPDVDDESTLFFMRVQPDYSGYVVAVRDEDGTQGHLAIYAAADVRTFDPATDTLVGQALVPIPYANNTRYQFVGETLGSTVRAKYFSLDDDPGGWQVEETDTTITGPGRIGFGHRYTGSAWPFLTYFDVLQTQCVTAAIRRWLSQMF